MLKKVREEAWSALHLAQVEERSELNVTQQHVELDVAGVNTMERICNIGNSKQMAQTVDTIHTRDILY